MSDQYTQNEILLECNKCGKINFFRASHIDIEKDTRLYKCELCKNECVLSYYWYVTDAYYDKLKDKEFGKSYQSKHSRKPDLYKDYRI